MHVRRNRNQFESRAAFDLEARRHSVPQTDRVTMEFLFGGEKKAKKKRKKKQKGEATSGIRHKRSRCINYRRVTVQVLVLSVRKNVYARVYVWSPGQGCWSHPAARMKVERCTSGRGVNPCERYHRNGTGGVVTCACRPTYRRATTLSEPLSAHRVPDRRPDVRASERPRYNPAQGPPKKRGRSSLSLGPSVPRAKDRGTARCRLTILATLRRHARTPFVRSFVGSFIRLLARIIYDLHAYVYMFTRFLIGVCVRVHARVFLSQRHTHAYASAIPRRWSLHAPHGYCVSFVGIFGDRGPRLPRSYQLGTCGFLEARTLAPLYQQLFSLSLFLSSVSRCSCALIVSSRMA